MIHHRPVFWIILLNHETFVVWKVVEAPRLLRSLLSLGPFRYDETYTLEATASGCRLRVEVDATCALPVIGGLIERFYLSPATKRDFASSLEALKRHCESTLEARPNTE